MNGGSLRAIHELSTLPDAPGAASFVEISSFVAHPHHEREEASELIVIMVVDVTERERLSREQAATMAEAEARRQRQQELLDESTRSVRELLTANQDLSSANVSLRSANEELLVGNEEAQAAMEEIETLNEEQQATNEELETLNEELQATVEELNATNEDLQARTLELQERAAAQEPLLATLREERQQLDMLLMSMSDAVMMVDSQGELILTNEAFRRMFGETLPRLEDASGHRLPARANLARMASRGESFTQPFTVTGSDGSRRWFEAIGQPIQADGIDGGVVVIREVTERSLRQLQEQFVALAGHELRTPLTALSGSLQLLQRSVDTVGDQRWRHYVELALSQTHLLGDLVQDLADVIRVQSGQLPIAQESVDMGRLIAETIELAGPMSNGQPIRFQQPDGDVSIRGDSRRLQQVLLNLLSNALQHGHSDDGVDVHVQRDDNTVILEVADHGPGIAPEDRERVFERFYQAGQDSGRGLGVGLFLAHAIILGHEGTIEVVPTNPHGTTFVVRLPLTG